MNCSLSISHFRNLFILVLFITSGLSSLGQNGPGGVGNSSSNFLWLEADNITGLVNNDEVTTWVDGSGNGNDLTQPDASFKPIFRTNILNGFPVIRFDGINDRIVRNPFNSFAATSITAIYVNITDGENQDGLLSYTSNLDNDFLIFDSDNLSFFRGGGVSSGVDFSDNVYNIANVGWRNTNGSTQVWKNGSLDFNITGNRIGTSIASGGSLAIGAEQDSPDGNYEASQFHTGDFAEVMLFNTYLNTAQHIIVSNYLSSKYGITLSTNDYYAHDINHSNDVAGIGREDVSNIHTAAMSADVLQIENASNLNLDQEYLLFGHDLADITTAWTTTEIPTGVSGVQRLAREWRLDETGDVGTVDFVVDIANMPALPVGFSTYGIMIDDDGDFTSGSVVYAMSLTAGTTYGLAGIDISDDQYVSIVAIRPTIEHTLTASNGFEPSNASVEVRLNFISLSDVSVDYATSDGTALSSNPDYTSVATNTITIPAGDSSINYTINVNNDVLVENSETFTIMLSNPSGAFLGPNAVHTYTILDDDDNRKVYFNLNASSGLESVSPITVDVSINNVDVVNPTTVDYSVTGGTSIGGGTDFTLANGTVTFNPGTTTSSFNILITDDIIFENDETIIITLSNPTNCNLDGLAPLGGTGFITHTYTIINNDNAPEIEFTNAAASGSESTTLISIPVELSEVSGIDAMANFTVTGSATGSGVDYALANGTLTIIAGNTTSTIDITVNNDAIEELSETIVVTLSGLVNASAGTNLIYTYTIVDDDFFGYLGPGGVGDLDNNKLWVKSSDLPVVPDGTDISSWMDASGNGNDLIQGNTSFTPRYYLNVLNGQPAVRFEQTNNRIVRRNFNDFPTDAITTIFVNRNNDSGDGLVSYASSVANNNDYLIFSSNNVSIFRGGAISTGTAINGNTFRIIGNTWQSLDGNSRFYRNGAQTSTGNLSSGTTITAGGTLAIGGEQDDVDGAYAANQAHQGDFTEVIIYDVILNSTRRSLVDNYLSSKYNITISSDRYAFDTPGSYENQVAGIGRDNVNNFHFDAQGHGIVRINTPSNLDDGEYLLWGHDNAGFDMSNVGDIPGGVDNRAEQVWRVDKTGDLGTVSVNFDLSGFTIGASSQLVLLIDGDDGLFTNASQVTVSSVSGGVATFNNINFNDGDWFTLASLSPLNPLPVELLDFKAELNENKVNLMWSTASEINNNFFTIERSQDGENWRELIVVEGAGNSSQMLDYYEVDYNPLEGLSYYRLKQTDFDGQFSYSEIEVIEYLEEKENNEIGALKVFPNPNDEGEIIYVEFNNILEPEMLLKLRDIQGKEYYSKTIFNIESGYVEAIPMGVDLPQGIYLITVQSKTQIYHQKLIIR